MAAYKSQYCTFAYMYSTSVFPCDINLRGGTLLISIPCVNNEGIYVERQSTQVNYTQDNSFHRKKKSCPDA